MWLAAERGLDSSVVEKTIVTLEFPRNEATISLISVRLKGVGPQRICHFRDACSR